MTIFHEFFAAIDAIVRRSRELRADWIAAKNYGTAAFTTALQKVVQYSAHFGSWTAKVVMDGSALDGPVQGGATIFQQHRAQLPYDAAALHAYLDAAMDAPEHEYDSHPSLSTRIASLPPFICAPVEDGGAMIEELAADEQRLSVAVTPMLQQMHALVAQHQMAEAAPQV